MMDNVAILLLDKTNPSIIAQAKTLLSKTFKCYETPAAAEKEMQNISEDERVCFVALNGNELIGLVGAIPQYSHAWELHPLVVDEAYRNRGIGRSLISALERELANRGIITIYLGTDDEGFKTSLSIGDLFEDTYNKIEHIKNKKDHPYEFYQKCGYKIVGVIPDANGRCKPDIWMAKRIATNESDQLSGR